MENKHWDYYLVGKKLQPAVDHTFKSYGKWRRDVMKLIKKYGAKEWYKNHFGLEETFSAVKFEKTPDPKLWKRVYKDDLKDAYWPRKNTKAGREIWNELMLIRSWKCDVLEEAVGYKWLTWSSRIFPFNAALDFKRKLIFFSVPSIPPQEKTPKDWYKPVSGVKKVSYNKLKTVLGYAP